MEVWLEGNDKVGDKCVVETLASDVECRVLYLFTDAMNPAVVSFDVEEKSAGTVGDGIGIVESEGLASSVSARAANLFGIVRVLGLFLRGIPLMIVDGGVANVG